METLIFGAGFSAQPPVIQQTGSEVVVNLLIEHNVDTLFGYTGAAVMPLLDAVFR